RPHNARAQVAALQRRIVRYITVPKRFAVRVGQRSGLCLPADTAWQAAIPVGTFVRAVPAVGLTVRLPRGHPRDVLCNVSDGTPEERLKLPTTSASVTSVDRN